MTTRYLECGSSSFDRTPGVFFKALETNYTCAFLATSLHKPCLLAEDVAPKKGYKALHIFTLCGV